METRHVPTKAFDTSSFRKKLNKKTPHLHVGFYDPQIWVSTGNYTLNYLASNDFFKGVPVENKVTIFAGDSGAGKSYIASANLIKEAQSKGIMCFLIDTENALDESWLNKLGVDTSENKLLKIPAITINDITSVVGEIINEFNVLYGDLSKENRPAGLIIIDSISMAMSEVQENQFDSSDMKGDMGSQQKGLKLLLKGFASKSSKTNLGLVCTAHTMDSQDRYKPDSIVLGGKFLEYVSSQMIVLNKSKLKEDEDGNVAKGVVHGIVCKANVRKSRYSKPFEAVDINIPYETGMNPYSGLFDLLIKRNLLIKEGYSYVYIFSDGTSEKRRKKEFDNDILDKIMRDVMIRDIKDTNQAVGFGLDAENCDDFDDIDGEL